MNMEIHSCIFPISHSSLLCLVLCKTYKIIAASNVSQVSEDSLKNKAVESSLHINAYMCIKIHGVYIHFLSKVF